MLIRVSLALLLSLSLIACETGSELPLDGDASIDALVDEDSGTVEPDLGVPDVGVVDIPQPDLQTDDCPDGAGCFGDPCDTADDCFSGLCTSHLGQQICTKLCDQDCPPGWGVPTYWHIFRLVTAHAPKPCNANSAPRSHMCVLHPEEAMVSPA
jgi:hypothetical protein